MTSNAFIGQAKTAIDEKGRTSFPREFRQNLTVEEGKQLVVSIGPDRTLLVYALDEFQKFMDSINARRLDRKTLDLQRRINGNSSYVSLDGQNRILLPKKLMAYAQLKNEVIFVGNSGKRVVELWNPEEYEARYGFNSADDFASFDEAFFDGGFTDSGDVNSGRT